MTTVIAVLRAQRPLASGEYLPIHVKALMNAVQKHWPKHVPLRRVVLSDTVTSLPGVELRALEYSWPRWWAKLELFDPKHDDLGDLLFLDLDTLILNSLEPLLNLPTLTVLRDFYRPLKMGSGLMYIPAGARAEIWENWMWSPPTHMRKNRGDQDYLGNLMLPTAARWQDVLPNQILSYKVDVKPLGGAIPDYARVVCFHGRPRPWFHEEWKANAGA